MLSVADCIALRHYVGVANNSLQRLKQVIEALVPVLTGLLLPPNVRNKVGLEEEKKSNSASCRRSMLYTDKEGKLSRHEINFLCGVPSTTHCEHDSVNNFG